MAYSSQTEFIQGIIHGDLAAPLVAFAAGTRRKIKNIVISAQAAGTLVQITGSPATNWFVFLGAGQTIILDGFETSNGLTIAGLAGGATTNATVLYFNG